MKISNLLERFPKTSRGLAYFLLIILMLAAFLWWRVGVMVTNQNVAAISNNLQLESETQVDSIIKIKEKEWINKLNSKENELERYKQMLAESNSRTIALVQTQLVYRDTGSIREVVVFVDSTSKDTIKNPIYTGYVSDKWMDLSIKATCDSINYILSTRDSLLVLFRNEKQGFLKPKKTVAYIYSQSPYSGDISQPMHYVMVPKRKGLFCRIWQSIFKP